MTSVTIHTETTEAAPITVRMLTIEGNNPRLFLACEIDDAVTLLLSHATAADLGQQLLDHVTRARS